MSGLDSPVEVPERRRHLFRWIAIGVGVVAIALVGVLATGSTSAQREADSPLIGRAAPDIEGPTIDGGTYDIDDQRGRWVVVNFFATWCVPCREEHPELVAFSERHARAGDASVVSVVFDDSTEAVRDFFDERGGDWPVVVGDTGPIAVDYGLRGVPESYLVAPNGMVVTKLIGGVTAAQLDELIVRASTPPEP